jgi:hypothetical protein
MTEYSHEGDQARRKLPALDAARTDRLARGWVGVLNGLAGSKGSVRRSALGLIAESSAGFFSRARRFCSTRGDTCDMGSVPADYQPLGLPSVRRVSERPGGDGRRKCG